MDRTSKLLIGPIAILLIALGILLLQYTMLDMFGSSIPSMDQIMAHWPQLERAPSLKGIRGEPGGMPLPDDWSVERLPKSGVVWPCGDDEAARVCYLLADGSEPDVSKSIDLAVNYGGKYMFIIQKGGNK